MSAMTLWYSFTEASAPNRLLGIGSRRGISRATLFDRSLNFRRSTNGRDRDMSRYSVVCCSL